MTTLANCREGLLENLITSFLFRPRQGVVAFHRQAPLEAQLTQLHV